MVTFKLNQIRIHTTANENAKATNQLKWMAKTKPSDKARNYNISYAISYSITMNVHCYLLLTSESTMLFLVLKDKVNYKLYTPKVHCYIKVRP